LNDNDEYLDALELIKNFGLNNVAEKDIATLTNLEESTAVLPSSYQKT
jgi:hypothetical protein